MTGHIVRISGGDISYDSIDYNSIFAIGLMLFFMTLAPQHRQPADRAQVPGGLRYGSSEKDGGASDRLPSKGTTFGTTCPAGTAARVAACIPGFHDHRHRGADGAAVQYRQQRLWVCGHPEQHSPRRTGGRVVRKSGCCRCPTSVHSEDDEKLAQRIAGNPNAIGFFGYAYYQDLAEELRPIVIDGVVPNADTVESGAYGLSRRLFLYSTAGLMQEYPQVASLSQLLPYSRQRGDRGCGLLSS